MSKTILAADIGHGNTKAVFDQDSNGYWNEICFKSTALKETVAQTGANQSMVSGLNRVSIPVNGQNYLVGLEAHVSGGSTILGTD